MGMAPACLAFDKNRAPVATASAAHVRKPNYRDAFAAACKKQTLKIIGMELPRWVSVVVYEL
jgi:hypothetical protein